MAGKTIFERAQFVQQPCDVLQTPTSVGSKVIRIRHPGYADRKNIMLDLECTDDLLDGLYHGLVHTAASIVAGNRFDGYLSRSREGAKVSQAIHELLPAGDYYFLLPSSGELSPTFLPTTALISRDSSNLIARCGFSA